MTYNITSLTVTSLLRKQYVTLPAVPLSQIVFACHKLELVIAFYLSQVSTCSFRAFVLLNASVLTV